MIQPVLRLTRCIFGRVTSILANLAGRDLAELSVYSIRSVQVQQLETYAIVWTISTNRITGDRRGSDRAGGSNEFSACSLDAAFLALEVLSGGSNREKEQLKQRTG
jgi:hypothetical protein